MALPVFAFLPHTGHFTGSLIRNLLVVVYFCFLFLQGIEDHLGPNRTFLHLHTHSVKNGVAEAQCPVGSYSEGA
jgi:hypothetical protein